MTAAVLFLISAFTVFNTSGHKRNINIQPVCACACMCVFEGLIHTIIHKLNRWIVAERRGCGEQGGGMGVSLGNNHILI